MKKIILTIALILFQTSTCFALEDCIISTNGKLTDIRIENNEIIDVFPLITLMNDKNTLIIHPLKVGKTKFCVLKNSKDIIIFNVKIEEDKTIIDEVEGFDILQIDKPPTGDEYDLDLPPMAEKGEKG